MTTQLTGEPLTLGSEIGQDSWQQLLHCTEAKLKQSDLYQQFLNHLRALGESTDETIAYLNSILRKTIQLTLQESQASSPVVSQDDYLLTDCPPNPIADVDGSTGEQEASQLPHQSLMEKVLSNRIVAKAVSMSKAESKADNAIDQHPLRAIGQEIKQHRTIQAITLEKLHHLTLVPIYHLKALEAGQIDKLPEVVYLRGFIQRIADALGVDSDRWLANLPSSETPEAFLPTWQPIRQNDASIHVSPFHLYLGYAALMTSAVGGLVWTAQPPILELPSSSLPHIHNDLTSDRQATSQLVSTAYMSISAPEALY
jgi:hypothetical protein